MATWTSGRKFPFTDQHSEFSSEHPTHFYEWEYQTTADVFTLKTTLVPTTCAYTGQSPLEGRIDARTMGPDEAEALYQTFRHWVLRYRGETVLAKLDAEVLSEQKN